MRVTFVLPTQSLAGGNRVVAIYAERLRRRGHDVLAVSTPKRPLSMRRRIKQAVTGCGWPFQISEPCYFDNLDVEHRVVDRWRPVADNDVPNADAVVATWWQTASWVAALSPSKGAKVYFVQDYGAHEGQPLDKVVQTWHLPLHKITISKWLLDLINQHSRDISITYVPNSVDNEQFYAPPRGKHARPTVGLMYSTRPQKGLGIMLEAITLAKKRHSNLHVVAYGPCDPVKSMPLPPGTEYSKLAPDNVLKDIYGKCDAWLFGSRLEGFGLPILEAMACRTPVIGTPAGAAPDLIGHGGGILVKAEDPDDMARAIERVCLMSEVEWREMSDAAYATATRYTWDDATDLFEAALQTAIERAQRGEIAGGPSPLKVGF